jgi:ubiquinone/menaquinone biosynthesis C-methylase UbiE
MVGEMSRDPLAERGFGSTLDLAWEYERGRPAFPEAAALAVADALELGPTSRVLDLAAGTGQLARLFVPLVGSVVAVEPAGPMREVLAARVPGVDVLDGQAEMLPVADQSVDAIVVGNAFHWFDPDRAIPELTRVLRSRGGLAILWNTGLTTEPPTPALEHLVDDLRARLLPAAHRSDTDTWRRPIERAAHLFEPLQYLEIAHEHRLDRETFSSYVGSLSFISALPDAERSEVLTEVHTLAPPSCVLTMRCECYWTRRQTRR